MLAAAGACFAGGICSFWMGRRLGQSGLEKFHWLHLTPERLKWPEHFFQRHGAKAVFIARFIPLFPPAVANLLAGMSKMRWNIFLIFNLTGSALYSISYILIGYFFRKKWKVLVAWLGPTALYVILLLSVVIVLCVIFRRSLSQIVARNFPKIWP